jgi:hypothetical protein
MMKKILGLFSFLTCMAVASFAPNASAALVIDFSTGGAGSGGTITDFGGGDIVGTDINIGLLTVDGSTGSDGAYVANALLNFSTGSNTIDIVGSVAGLGIAAGTTLLSGSFDSWSFGPVGSNEVFNGSGPDIKDIGLLRELGVDPSTPFNFFGFSVESSNGSVISTDIVNTAVVPVPAAVWLFGSGLLGLVGVARRRA